MRRTMNCCGTPEENKVGERDEAEKRARQARITRRFEIETLYRIGPNDEARLIDGDGDSSDRSERTRDAAGLAWAEQRLQSLGVDLVPNGKVKQYVELTQTYEVWADPRERGEIIFHVHTKKIGKDNKRRYKHVGRFRIPDRCTDNLADRYRRERDERLGKAKR